MARHGDGPGSERAAQAAERQRLEAEVGRGCGGRYGMPPEHALQLCRQHRARIVEGAARRSVAQRLVELRDAPHDLLEAAARTSFLRPERAPVTQPRPHDTVGVLDAERRAERLQGRFAGAHRLLSGKYYVDELYEAVLGRPLHWISEQVFLRFGDRVVIDGSLHGLTGLAQRAATRLGRVETGNLQFYVMLAALGVVASLAWMWRHG